MKKILLILCLLTAGNITKSWAQEPVVIKQDGATGDLDAEENEEPDVRDLSFRERLKFGAVLVAYSLVTQRLFLFRQWLVIY
jgi:predicted ABC-type transport system involved in lysophospholipase L1 biosynthesis ATPase subunit